MLLHSDIARLVLGYLAQENLNQSYTTFLNESPHLQNIKHLLQGPSSMYVSTLNIFGKTLCIILDEYSTMKETEATYLRSQRNEGQKTHITQLWEKLEDSITALRSHQIASLVEKHSHPDNELAPMHPGVTPPSLRRMSPFRAGSRNKVTRLVLKNVGRRVRSKIKPLLPSQTIQTIDAQQPSQIPQVTHANQVFSPHEASVHSSSVSSSDMNTPLPTNITTQSSSGVSSAPSSVEQSRRQKAKRAPKRLSDVERRVIERSLNDDPGEALLQHVTNNQTEVMSVVGATIMQQIKNCAQATNSPAESRLINSGVTPNFCSLDADIAKHNQDAIASMTLESLLETDFLKPDKEFARELEGILTSPKEQSESIDIASPPSAARLSYSPPFLSPSTPSVNLSSDASPTLPPASVAMPTTSIRSPGTFPTIAGVASVDVAPSLGDVGSDIDMDLESALPDNVASDLGEQPLENIEGSLNETNPDLDSQEENTSPNPLNNQASSKSPLLQSSRPEIYSVSPSLDNESTNTNPKSAQTSVSSKVSQQSSAIIADPSTPEKSSADQPSSQRSDLSPDVSFEGPSSLQIEIDLNASETEDDYLPSLQEVLGNKTRKSSGGYFHLGRTNRRQQPSAAKRDEQVTNEDNSINHNLQIDLELTADNSSEDIMEINHAISPNVSPAKPTQTLNISNNIQSFECPSLPKSSTEKVSHPNPTIPDIVQRSPAKCTRSQVRAQELSDLSLPPRSLSAEKGKTPKIRIKSARSCIRERKEKRRSLENKKDSSGEKDKSGSLLAKEVGKTRPCSVVIDTKSDMTWMFDLSKEDTSQVVTSPHKTPSKSRRKQTGKRTPQKNTSVDFPPSPEITCSPEQTILEVVKLQSKTITSCESEDEPREVHRSPRKLTLRYGLRAIDPGSDTSASQLVIDSSSDHNDAGRNDKSSTAGNKPESNVVDITAPDSDSHNSKRGEDICNENAACTKGLELDSTEPCANLNSSVFKPPFTKDVADLRQESKDSSASSYHTAPCSPYVGRTVQVDEQGVESVTEVAAHPSDDESTLRASDVEIDDLVLDERDEIAGTTEASASEKLPLDCVEIPTENMPLESVEIPPENTTSHHVENLHEIPPSNQVEISLENTTLRRLEIPHKTTTLNQVEIPPDNTTLDCVEIPNKNTPSYPVEIPTKKPSSNNIETPTDNAQLVHFSNAEIAHQVPNPSVMRQSAVVRVPKGDKGVGMQDIIDRLVNQVRATTRKVLPGRGDSSVVTVQLDGNGTRPGVTTIHSRPTLVYPKPQGGVLTAVSSNSNGVMLESEALVSNLCSEEVTGESLTLLLNETSLTQMVAAAKQLNNPPAQNAADEKALACLEASSTTAAFSTISPHTGIFSVFGDDEKRGTTSSEAPQPHSAATPGLISWLNTSVPPSTHHGTPVAPIAARRNLDFNSGNPHHPHHQVISTPGYYSNVSPAYEGNKKPRYRKLLPKTYPGFSGSGIDPVSIRPDTIKLDLPEGAVVRDLEVQDSKIANRYSSFNPPRQHTVKTISIVGQPITVSQTIKSQPKPTNQKAAHFQPITLPISAQSSHIQTPKPQPIPAKKTIFLQQPIAMPDSAQSLVTQQSKSPKPVNNIEVASTLPKPIAVTNARSEQADQSQPKAANENAESNPPIAALDAGHVLQAQSEPANQEADSTSEKAPNLRKSDRLRKKHTRRMMHYKEGDPYVYTSAIPSSLFAAQGDDSVSSSIDVAPPHASQPTEGKPQEIASTVAEKPSEIELTLPSKTSEDCVPSATQTDASSNHGSSPTKPQSTSAPLKKSKSSKKPPKGKSLDSSGLKDSESKAKKKKKKKKSSKAKDEAPPVDPDQDNIVLQYLHEEEAKISSPEEGELRILESPIAEARAEKQEKVDSTAKKTTAISSAAKKEKSHGKKRKKSLDHEERVARKRKKLMRSLNNVTNEELAEILTFVHGRDGSTTPFSPDHQGIAASSSGRSDELLRLLSEPQEPKSSRRKRTKSEAAERASEVGVHKFKDFVAERLEVKESPSKFRFPPPPKSGDSNPEKTHDVTDAALSESSRTVDSNLFGDDSNMTFKLPSVSSPCSAEVSLASERGGVKQQQKQQQQRSARRGKKLKRRISLTRVPISPSKLGASPLHLRTPSPALVCRDSPDTVNLVAESLLELSRSHDADVETPLLTAVAILNNKVGSEDDLVASKENVRVADLAQKQSSCKEHKNRDRKSSDPAKEATPSSEKKSNKKKHKKRKDILDKLDISKFLSKVHYE